MTHVHKPRWYRYRRHAQHRLASVSVFRKECMQAASRANGLRRSESQRLGSLALSQSAPKERHRTLWPEGWSHIVRMTNCKLQRARTASCSMRFSVVRLKPQRPGSFPLPCKRQTGMRQDRRSHTFYLRHDATNATSSTRTSGAE